MLTLAEIDRIAELARLSLSDEERARFARQLSAILDYAAALEQVDVEGIPPTATVLVARSVMRAGDQVAGSLPRDEVLANAPDTDGYSFVVQATFDDEDE